MSSKRVIFCVFGIISIYGAVSADPSTNNMGGPENLGYFPYPEAIVDHYQAFLGTLAIIISFFTYVLYSADIFRGKTKPHAFSWLIWAILGSIAFFGQRADAAGPGSWLVGFVAFACLIIFFLALHYGEPNMVKFDWICLICSLTTIPLWIISKTPLWSMILVTTIDVVGFLPTFRKSWAKPNEETISLYALSAVSNLISIFALNKISLITGLYPVAVMFMNLSFVLLAVWRRHALP